jgi:cob(I)alamin adenosyltransferase
MKIYTKTGDGGNTGLFAGPRVPKHHPRIEAYGTVDELSALLGVAIAHKPPGEVANLLRDIQHQLLVVGSELATPVKGEMHIGAIAVEQLERAIDRFDAQLPVLKEFILSGGVPASAALHHARTVCRRAERRVTELISTAEESISARVLVYLNRLSDLLFVLARVANHAAGVDDTPWCKPIQLAPTGKSRPQNAE